MLSGIAQLLAARIRTMQGFHLVINLALLPLLFFSGAFFPLDDLPAWLQALALINPITYAVDLLHLATYANSTDGYIGVLPDVFVLVSISVLLFLAGLRRAPAYS
jgi:ABC-2 type transport system permease protein